MHRRARCGLEAVGHDVTTRPYDKGRFTRQVGADLGKLAEQATA